MDKTIHLNNMPRIQFGDGFDGTGASNGFGPSLDFIIGMFVEEIVPPPLPIKIRRYAIQPGKRAIDIEITRNEISTMFLFRGNFRSDVFIHVDSFS